MRPTPYPTEAAFWQRPHEGQKHPWGEMSAECPRLHTFAFTQGQVEVSQAKLIKLFFGGVLMGTALLGTRETCAPCSHKKTLLKYMDAQPSPRLYPAPGLTLYKPIGFFFIGFFLIGFFLIGSFLIGSFLIGFFLPPLRTLTCAGRDKTNEQG